MLRASYGRATKAQYIFDKDSVDYYLPLHRVVKLVNNKRKKILEPLLPSLIFVYAKKDYVQSLVRTNGYLSYYYNHFAVNEYGKNPPLTVDYHSMMNFIKVTSVDNEHVRVVETKSCHYKSGDVVRVIDGEFKGVEGKVARVAGQQRVVVEIEGLCLVATAYIPTAFIEPVDGN